MDRKELGKILKAHREKQGITVSHVADFMLLNPGDIERIESGDWNGTLKVFLKYCTAINYQLTPE